MSQDFALRVQRLEDRNAISERVITYAMAIDDADWDAFRDCFTDIVHVDFSSAGMPAREFARDEFVAFARSGLSIFKARQHLSPNHLISFDERYPDRAHCRSYMYAQHYQPGSAMGEVFLMHGSYANGLRRTESGGKIDSLVQHVSWMDGAPDARLTDPAGV